MSCCCCQRGGHEKRKGVTDNITVLPSAGLPPPLDVGWKKAIKKRFGRRRPEVKCLIFLLPFPPTHQHPSTEKKAPRRKSI